MQITTLLKIQLKIKIRSNDKVDVAIRKVHHLSRLTKAKHLNLAVSLKYRRAVEVTIRLS